MHSALSFPHSSGQDTVPASSKPVDSVSAAGPPTTVLRPMPLHGKMPDFLVLWHLCAPSIVAEANGFLKCMSPVMWAHPY